MADNKNGLPEGTDTVIEGGGSGGSGGGQGRSGTSLGGGSPSTSTNSTGGRTSATGGESQTDALITGNTASAGTGAGSASSAGGSSSISGSTGGGAGSTSGGLGGSTGGSDGGLGGSTGSSSGGSGTALATTGDTGSSGGESDSSSSSSSGGIRGIVGNVGTKAKTEAANRARTLVGDSLKSGSTTLGNVANIIEDTVEQIGERLGPQYADYARTASETINRYASTLENKNPDELVDDARELIRKSPGIAVTGAAILGFGLVRLVKAGIPEEGFNGNGNRQSDRTGTAG